MQTPTPRTIEIPEGLVVFNNKYFWPVDADGFKGYRMWRPPIEAEEVKDLALEWTGAKIPIALVHQVYAFFEEQYALTKGEAQARFFYNPKTNEWTVWAFPQEWSSSMTTKEIADHPDRAIQSEALGADFICYGTIHHHCEWAAFQSGTDTNDEEQQNGIHITVGHLGKASYDLHGRVYFCGQKYSLTWEHWFDLNPIPPWVYLINEPEARQKAIEWCMEKVPDKSTLLKQPPPKATPFPKAWMDNLIKPAVTVYQGGFQGNGGGHHGHNFPHSERTTQSFTQNYKTSPSPVIFLREVDNIIADIKDQLGFREIKVLIDEVCEYPYKTFNHQTANHFLVRIKKAATEADIFPVHAVYRMLRKHLLGARHVIPVSDMDTVELICIYAAEYDFLHGQLLRIAAELFRNGNYTGATDDEKSFVQEIRQLSVTNSRPIDSICELIWDHIDSLMIYEVKKSLEQAINHRMEQGQQGDPRDMIDDANGYHGCV